MRFQATLRWIALSAVLIPSIAATRLDAHDIPADVHVHIIVKPAIDRLRVLVRAPLKSMLDVSFPKRGRDFLDIGQADTALQRAASLWIATSVEAYENDIRTGAPRVAAVRASIESDTSFRSYDEAMALVTGPRMPDDVLVPWDQATLDVLLEYPIASDRSEFSIHPRLGRLGLKVETSMIFHAPDGRARAVLYTGDAGLIRLDPRWHQTAVRFVGEGFNHALEGVDHLLFLLCLVAPIRRLRPLIVVVTAFTLGHSMSLAAASAGMTPGALWFPPLIETLIAGSILYMALENIVRRNPQRREVMALCFGLVHGFGFSAALENTLQFAGSLLLVPLVSFNAGVEIGQVLALAIMVPALHLAYRWFKPERERTGVIIISAFIAHTAWHWTLDRGSSLAQYRMEWPGLGTAELAAIALWIFVATLIAAAIWLVRPWIDRVTGV
jgi:hypothetical protein